MNFINNLSDIAKKMALIVCFLISVIIFIGILFLRSMEAVPFALGALTGGAVNIIKIILLDRTTKKVIQMELQKAAIHVQIQHLLRLLITGAGLLFAALVPFISLWGAAIGVLAYQIAIYLIKKD